MAETPKTSYNFRDNYNISHSVSHNPPNFSIHAHDWYELYFFISGDVSYYVEGQRYDIQKNDILLMNDQELHKPEFNSAKIYERFVIHFKPEYITKFQTGGFNLVECFENRKPGQLNKVDATDVIGYKLDQYFLEMENYIRKEIPETQVMIETLLVQLLVLLNKIQQQNKDIYTHPVENDNKLRPILTYINQNLDSKISLDFLADKFYISKYYLCHLFKENTSFTVIQYITYKRIMEAKKLLTSGNSCTETSQKLGFGDYSYFYKVFKRIVGISPRTFQENYTRKINTGEPTSVSEGS